MALGDGKVKILGKGTQVGPYMILQPVPGGVGGMAVVYKARLKRQIVALKVAHQGLSGFLKDEGAFLKARELEHPHIIRILPTPMADGSKEYIVKDPRTGCWYFAMEFMQGGDLDQWLQRRKKIPLPEAIEVLAQVGNALDAAHRAGVVHLDVKPSNILFRDSPDRNALQAVLTDFGIARPQGRIASGQTLTIEYASPEQARRAQGENVPVHGASDIYSLAVIFYEMLAGKLPFEAQNDTAMLHHIVYDAPMTNLSNFPVQLASILKRALAKEPQQRYLSAQELIAELQRLPIESYVSLEPEPQRREQKRLPQLVALGVGILIGLGFGGPAGYYWRDRQDLPRPETTKAMVISSTVVASPTSSDFIEVDETPTVTPETDNLMEEESTPTREPTSTPNPPTRTPTPRPRPTFTPAGTPETEG